MAVGDAACGDVADVGQLGGEWAAGPDPDLQVCWRAYLRRFDIEHTFRFVKNTLGWTTPSVRTPEQADRWT